MKNFLKHTLLFALIQFCILMAMLSQYQVRPEGFYAEINHKHRMLETSKPPRLLLVGGSNVGFGHDSERLTSELGLETLNLGLIALTGLEPALNEVDGFLGKGDVVVISPVYENLAAPLKGSREFFKILEQRPAYVANMDGPSLASLLDEALPYLGAVARSVVFGDPLFEPNIEHSDFNERGDISSWREWVPKNKEAHRLRISRRRLLSDGYNPAYASEQIEKLNQRFPEWQGRGCRIFFSFPSIPRPQFERHRPRLLMLQAQLRRELKIPILDSVESQVFPAGEFYDTEYHLRGPAVKIRTERLIEALRKQGVGSVRTGQAQSEAGSP